MTNDFGRLAGSHPTDQAPAGLGAPRFDPGRVREALYRLNMDLEDAINNEWDDVTVFPDDLAVAVALAKFAAGDK